jgi:hypothetical protein
VVPKGRPFAFRPQARSRAPQAPAKPDGGRRPEAPHRAKDGGTIRRPESERPTRLGVQRVAYPYPFPYTFIVPLFPLRALPLRTRARTARAQPTRAPRAPRSTTSHARCIAGRRAPSLRRSLSTFDAAWTSKSLHCRPRRRSMRLGRVSPLLYRPHRLSTRLGRVRPLLCRQPCPGGIECNGEAYCAFGVCVAKRPIGSLCTRDEECLGVYGGRCASSRMVVQVCTGHEPVP